MQLNALINKYEGEEPKYTQQPGDQWHVTDVESVVRGGVMPEEAGTGCYGNTHNGSGEKVL